MLKQIYKRASKTTLGSVRYLSSTNSIDMLSSSLSSSTVIVKSVGNYGIQAGNINLKGPVIILNNLALMWDVPQYGIGGPDTMDDKNIKDDPSSPFYGWNEEMFKVFELVEPAPEILIIGCGANTYMLPPKIKSYLHGIGIQTEVMPSKSAGSTFNILLQEGRMPALAILPIIPTSAKTGKVLVELLSSNPDLKNKDAVS